ncbi:spore germination protein [Cohnella faecalis]|uniref:Spore germination protein n=1 Tax=Cohnella faecalis TaxID=2315694 RepID=A0A398CP40_9BACL|nr:spore germination protein [Cohnella faecalis]RIE05146.1 hypothetical protein D3H35_01885 [Cohnella faecalis]
MSEARSKEEPKWSEDRVRELFRNSADVIVQKCQIGDDSSTDIVLAYSDGLCDSSQIGLVVLPGLSKLVSEKGTLDDDSVWMAGKLPLVTFDETPTSGQLSESVFQGDLLIFILQSGTAYRLSIGNLPRRSPSESNTEISIKGPKDGFVEDIVVNVALIRKRIRSSDLCNESFTIGRRTKTRISLLYFHDIISPDVLKEVKRRLSQIDIDGIYGSGQIEEMIADSKYSMFPLFASTGRPDYTVNSLLAGRFVLIVDGSPLALIGPAELSLILKSPEDIHFNYAYVSFARVVRGQACSYPFSFPGFGRPLGISPGSKSHSGSWLQFPSRVWVCPCRANGNVSAAHAA